MARLKVHPRERAMSHIDAGAASIGGNEVIAAGALFCAPKPVDDRPSVVADQRYWRQTPRGLRLAYAPGQPVPVEELDSLVSEEERQRVNGR